MENSHFLARLIGPLMLIMGLSIMFNPDRIRRVGREFLSSEGLLFTSGMLAATAGLAMVLAHNVWTPDWRGAITLIGWITLSAGLARLLMPASMYRVGEEMLEKPMLIAVPGAIMALFGAWLSYQGYFA